MLESSTSVFTIPHVFRAANPQRPLQAAFPARSGFPRKVLPLVETIFPNQIAQHILSTAPRLAIAAPYSGIGTFPQLPVQWHA